MRKTARQGKKIAIVGFGKEGRSALKFLKRHPAFRNAEIDILDKKRSPDYLKDLAQYGLIVKSPGVSFNVPEIKAAGKAGQEFSSSTDLFFRHAQGTVIGVTGTKGKGTTSTLIYKILKAAGRDAYLAGNIGTPAIEVLPKLKKSSITVLELSSFQLHNLRHSPGIAVVLDIFPDHMDSHKDFREYVDAKASIARWQKRNDRIFYFSDNTHSAYIASQSPGRKFGVALSSVDGLLNDVELKIPGPHNQKNAAMAATVALALGVDTKIIKRVLRNYAGLEHRLEFVRETRGVRLYNDSGSTNPETAAAAIRSFPETKILIAGGKDKNLNYAPLARALKNSRTLLTVLFGENKEKIRKAILASRVPIRMAADLREAVEAAYREALKSPETPVHVIFSPGSASFDMFSNYKDRGKKFKALVASIK